ncbi:MAG: MTH938/NDUFAF3 family protein [Pseudomonadota bacterium]
MADPAENAPGGSTVVASATPSDWGRPDKRLSTPGLEIRQAHFPGRAPVDSYGAGGFRFADMSHRGSIMLLPSGIYGWTANTLSDITPSSLTQLKGETDLELVLFGTGQDLQMLDEATLAFMDETGLRAEVMATGAAARTFNVLLAEGRPVGAALLAVA